MKTNGRFYRKKPVIIEAIQWNGGNTPEILAFCNGCASVLSSSNLMVGTLEGPHQASIGDYIIKGVAGEFYPCKPEIFLQTYDPA